jgi:hypothetical protein
MPSVLASVSTVFADATRTLPDSLPAIFSVLPMLWLPSMVYGIYLGNVAAASLERAFDPVLTVQMKIPIELWILKPRSVLACS